MADPDEGQGEVHIYRQHGRFYENEFPEVDDRSMVVVQVLKMDDKSGAYVSLLEYDGKEGMINLGELSKKRIRSLRKILMIGGIEVCSVMSVDEEKGYINLSKKRVEPDDAAPVMERFAKAKAVHGIMQHVSKTHGIQVEDLCSKVSWPLHAKHGSAFDAFKKHLEEDDLDVWADVDFSQPGTDVSHLADKLKQDIEMQMRRRLIASTLRLQAKCEVSCTEYEGIDAVKEALMEGFKASKEDYEVSIKLIAHPVFALSCICRDKEMGVATLTEALELVKKSIESKKGLFNIISVPQIQKKEEKKDASSDEDDDDDKEGDSGSEKEAEEMPDMVDEKDLKALESAKLDDD